MVTRCILVIVSLFALPPLPWQKACATSNNLVHALCFRQKGVESGEGRAMMDIDDDKPIRKPAHEVGMRLDTLSVDELEERIVILTDEIARLQAAIAAKKASRNAADSVFKI
jgi:uncharacterized small protein (DUF1192 family)